jgi:hypothetical protein
MKDTESALKWIISILEKHNIQFQIGGGFAAHVYGSGREIADIDIALPEEKFETILPDIQKYVISGPKHFADKDWDLEIMTAEYKGQIIDFCGSNKKKFFDHTKNVWVAFPSDFTTTEYREILWHQSSSHGKGETNWLQKDARKKGGYIRH